jgi:hypothetical protein
VLAVAMDTLHLVVSDLGTPTTFPLQHGKVTITC